MKNVLYGEILAYDSKNNLIAVWSHDSTELPVIGYFQPTYAAPDPVVGTVGKFDVVCKKSEKGTFYNKIYSLERS